MKIILVLLLAAAAVSGLPAEKEVRSRTNMDQLAEDAIAFFYRLFKYGDPSLGVPVMDPYRVEFTQANLPGSFISAWMELRNAALYGLSDFEIHELHLDPHTLILDYDMSFPKISARAEYYRMFGQVWGVLPHWGEGEAWYDIYDLRMRGWAKLERAGDAIVIHSIGDAQFSLRSVDARTTGYIGGGDIDKVMNSMITDLAADYCSRFSRTLSLYTAPHFKSSFNYVLSQLDTWHHLEQH